MQPLPVGDLAATPWSLSPFWFIGLALGVPALLWLGLAWRRALLECPNRIRRAGLRELRRLLKSVQRSDTPPRPAHLHAWLRATARVWNIRTSAPCVGEVTQAAHALSGDPAMSSRWRELWQATEHGLYAPNAQPTQEWLQLATSVVTTVDMPKRERMFPNRLAHWLPSLAGAALIVCLLGSQSQADVPWSSPAAPVHEDSNLAIAHATAAFIHHPSDSNTRNTLLAALGETELVDSDLRRLLSGAWHQRLPTLLSPAAWQRMALIAALMAAAGFCVMIVALYSPRNPLVWAGRGVAALGVIVLIASATSWKAYGAFGHPEAAIVVQDANVSPVPTDLVPTEETSPLSAGAVVVAGRSFLGWRKVDGGREISGWVRDNALMPLYAGLPR